jgi:four helix bundle protein
MQPFERLRVWQLAHELAVELHRRADAFPPAQRLALTDQLRRSAASVGANIAEGSMALSPREFVRLLNIAEREAAETASHLVLARDLGYLQSPEAERLLADLTRLRRMLNRLRQRVADDIRRPGPGPRHPAGALAPRGPRSGPDRPT